MSNIEKILKVKIEDEMQKSYIDYAMSVIIGRALPDVRDGLKPVHRRILYSMYEDNLTFEHPYYKSATTVGNVLGKYHPHGDASVYDAMVRMAQTFSLRYPLIEGHGNFGSIDGDPPAAYRYTESRLSHLSKYMMEDIEKNTVDFHKNFDDKRLEPDILPSRFPNLIVNGSSGIAVGMATNMLPHNLSEVINGICYLIDNPNSDVDEIFNFIKGPDFPGGGIIVGRSGILLAYKTGKGKIIVRAKTHFEYDNRSKIIVDELPYLINKAKLIENIVKLIKNKKIEGISDLRDESDRNGMRMVIELKRDSNKEVVLNQLFQYTNMQCSFSINNLALVDNQPKVLGLLQLLNEYINFQEKLIIRRTNFELKQLKIKLHVLEGLQIAIINIEEIIRILKSSVSISKAKFSLLNKMFYLNNEEYRLSEEQSKAILDMKLSRLTNLESSKLKSDILLLNNKIQELNFVLSDDINIKQILKNELLIIKNKFGDNRKTKIIENDEYINNNIENLIEKIECVYTLTNCGYIKRLPANTYKSQKRGGKGITAMGRKEDDFVKILFAASTHDNILFFTNKGKVYKLKGYRIPESSRIAKGINIINLLKIDNNEHITAMFPIKNFTDEMQILLFVTKYGIVKKLNVKSFQNIRKAGIKALKLGKNDELINVHLAEINNSITIASYKGKAMTFNEKEIRCMGRNAKGVIGIRLTKNDYVIGAAILNKCGEVLTITENGYCKRTKISEYTVHHRGGHGIILHKINKKTGNIAGITFINNNNDDIMIITEGGIMIRIPILDIRLCGRSSSGVIAIRTVNKVISIINIGKEENT